MGTRGGIVGVPTKTSEVMTSRGVFPSWLNSRYSSIM